MSVGKKSDKVREEVKMKIGNGEYNIKFVSKGSDKLVAVHKGNVESCVGVWNYDDKCIYLNKDWWSIASKYEKNYILLHEMLHAFLYEPLLILF